MPNAYSLLMCHGENKKRYQDQSFLILCIFKLHTNWAISLYTTFKYWFVCLKLLVSEETKASVFIFVFVLPHEQTINGERRKLQTSEHESINDQFWYLYTDDFMHRAVVGKESQIVSYEQLPRYSKHYWHVAIVSVHAVSGRFGGREN